ncbi:hypothetical protein CLAFUW4_14479 [Fulvia fulva]|uniref:Uncharacterized protein n=1 Tax=Passalora fulva TaxID=5499 RepID=A0A9Q8PMD6_PASFU|nr:uncharacterized protein CLAFUR5_14311 [Fulvia fulva]KAK4609087.1 hypothetical protein CLAFUR4_14474 [Fulvia fulva]KAK4609886.1 hypothetical protein CLAFUR0_14476 [Fulvia fulva]UJO25096.1 hypothetical protein CLAFUR5_14311 [Fulvia fulva]WPV22635.1 hypothetical protein CLAFUW4_14479 [Fulvia fulva]WPV37748.1 hypothetical protein CLAFUW7_14483 [Fulvia fulva]
MYRNGRFDVYGWGPRTNEALRDGPIVFPAADQLYTDIENVAAQAAAKRQYLFQPHGISQPQGLDSMLSDLADDFVRLSAEAVWHIDGYDEMKAATNRPVDKGHDEDQVLHEELHDANIHEDVTWEQTLLCTDFHCPLLTYVCNSRSVQDILWAYGLNNGQPGTDTKRLLRHMFMSVASLHFCANTLVLLCLSFNYLLKSLNKANM